MLKFRPTNKRAIAGKVAQKKGQRFETFIKNSCSAYNFYPIQVPDGCDTVRDRTGSLKLLRVQTPFDFILIGNQQAIFLDTKTTQDKTFSHSKIKHHQLKSLLEASKAGPAGYLVNFESERLVVFFPAQVLEQLRPRQSLKPADGLILGAPETWNPRKIIEHWILSEAEERNLD